MGFFFSSRRRHTRCGRDWSSDVCSSDLSRRQEVPPERLDLADGGEGRNRFIGQAFSETGPGAELEYVGDRRVVEVCFHHQNRMFPPFRQGGGEVESYRRFAVVAERAGDEEFLEPDRKSVV